MAKLVMTLPIGSVANERRFSRMNAVKNTNRNRLGLHHLNSCLRIADSTHTYLNFPYNRAFDVWWDNRSKQNRRGSNTVPRR